MVNALIATMVALAGGCNVATVAACEIGRTADGATGMDASQRLEMYGNTSSAPSYIKIQVEDSQTGHLWLVLENGEFASYLASQRQIEPSQLPEFYRCEYVNFMLRNAQDPMAVDLVSLETYLAQKRFGSRSAARKYLSESKFERPLRLEDFGVSNREALVKKYFEFDAVAGVGRFRTGMSEAKDRRLIALLIDLGYVVSRGDLAPILWIRDPR